MSDQLASPTTAIYTGVAAFSTASKAYVTYVYNNAARTASVTSRAADERRMDALSETASIGTTIKSVARSWPCDCATSGAGSR